MVTVLPTNARFREWANKESVSTSSAALKDLKKKNLPQEPNWQQQIWNWVTFFLQIIGNNHDISRYSTIFHDVRGERLIVFLRGNWFTEIYFFFWFLDAADMWILQFGWYPTDEKLSYK